MIKKRKKSSFSKFFWNKPYFFCLNLNSTWKMHSFDVYIVDIAQKLQNLKFCAIYWSNCTISVILQFFPLFAKKFLKMALMSWKWSQFSGKCVSGGLSNILRFLNINCHLSSLKFLTWSQGRSLSESWWTEFGFIVFKSII